MKGILRAGYLPQDGITLTGRTVFDECMTVFREVHELEAEQQSLARRMAELDHSSPEYQQIGERFHHVQAEFTARDGYNIESRVGAVLSGPGFRREDWPRRVEEFSGGWQMRIALAKLLLEEPNLLLLDEPTNHLDLEARNWLEGYLDAYPNAFVLISQMTGTFLDVTVSKIAEIWNKRVWFYTGGYSKYEQQKTERAHAGSKPPTPTSATASKLSKPSSTGSVIRPPRLSRCRAASRSWRRLSASRFPRTRRRYISVFRSRSRVAAWWRSSAT